MNKEYKWGNSVIKWFLLNLNFYLVVKTWNNFWAKKDFPIRFRQIAANRKVFHEYLGYLKRIVWKGFYWRHNFKKKI